MDIYPLSLNEERSYPEGYDGIVFVWDIDKTYLATRFSSMGGLARIPLEFAVDKRAIPGMAEVLRGLRRGTGAEYACHPLYFVSASPAQMRPVVERKMLLDGVEHDGIIFKDWARAVLQLRPGRLHEQLGFKLCALLTGRQSRPKSREVLFGDDVEQDAEAFELYARMVGGELSAGEAEAAMAEAGVKGDDRRCVRGLMDRLGFGRGGVERIYINLEHDSPPGRYAGLSSRVVAVKGGYQMALALYMEGHIPVEAARQALEAVRAAPLPYGRTIAELREDALARGLISPERLGGLRP